MKENPAREWAVAYVIALTCLGLIIPIAALADWAGSWGWLVVLLGVPLLFPFIAWSTNPARRWNR